MANKTFFVGTCFDTIQPGPGAGDDGSRVWINGGSSANFVECRMTDPETGEHAGQLAAWFHMAWDYATANNQGNFYPIQVYKAGDTSAPVFRLAGVTGGVWSVQYKSGDTFTEAGTFACVNDKFDFLIDIPQGTIKVYTNGQAALIATGLDLSGVANLATLRLGPNRSYNEDCGFSGILIANYNTIGHVVSRKSPNANGVNNTWTGTFEDVDEGRLDDTDNVTAEGVGLKQGFTGPAFPAPASGSVVKAVVVATRARNNGTAPPLNIRHYLRLNGTDHTTAYSHPQIDEGFNPLFTAWDLNPETGRAWSSAIEADVEFGMEALA